MSLGKYLWLGEEDEQKIGKGWENLLVWSSPLEQDTQFKYFFL